MKKSELIKLIREELRLLRESDDDYGIRWSEFNKSNRIVNKQKFFKTKKQRDKFADKIEKKDNFNEFIAWSDPDEGLDEATCDAEYSGTGSKKKKIENKKKKK